MNSKQIPFAWHKWFKWSLVGVIAFLSLVLILSWIYPLKPEFQLDATTTSFFLKLSKDWELSRSIELIGDDIRLVGNISASIDGSQLVELSKLAISSDKEGKAYINKLSVPAGSIVSLYSTNQPYVTIEITLPNDSSTVTGSLKVNEKSQLCTKDSERSGSENKEKIFSRKRSGCIDLVSSIIPKIISFTAEGNSFQINAKPGKAFDLDNFEIANLSFARKVVSRTDKIEFRCGLQGGTLFVTDILEERKLYKQTCLELRNAQANTSISWNVDTTSIKVIGRATIEPVQLLPSMFYYFWKLPQVVFFKDLLLGFVSIFIAVWGLILTWRGVFGGEKG